MQAIAKARYVRISPRKVDQILMLVRGKSVAQALSTLRLVTKHARPLVEKVLISALANAGKLNQNPERVVCASSLGGLWADDEAYAGSRDGPRRDHSSPQHTFDNRFNRRAS